MKRRIPSLNAVRAFEAAARHSSFTLAAEELDVTPTAISHQIRHLEDLLSIKLFERNGRYIVLTEQGAHILPSVVQGFNFLASAFENVYESANLQRINLSVTRAFARYWLQPRLDNFYQRFPQYTLNICADENCIDLTNNEIDLVVRYGSVDQRNENELVLFKDHYVAVAHVSLIKGSQKSISLEKVTQKRLLDVRWTNPDMAAPNWKAWFLQHNQPGYSAFKLSSYDEYNLVFDALKRGHGMALLSNIMLNAYDDIVLIEGEPLPGYYYRAILSESGKNKRAAADFMSWLEEELS
ncbi:MAG: LysR family transcriptional regulator [Oceanospirillaceae bacterium]